MKNHKDQKLQEILQNYLKSISETAIDKKTEHTDRGHLKTLLSDFAKYGNFKAQAINEQARQGKNTDGFGAPDFTVNHTEKHNVIGYIENKKIDENLDKILKSKQIAKYHHLSDNLLVTDYLEWIWLYKASEPVKIRLCEATDLYKKNFKIGEDKANEFYQLISKFYSIEPDKITNAKILAEKLALPTIELRKYIVNQLDFQLIKENQHLRCELYAVYEIFKEGLFEELATAEFADGFAQMLTYSIFLAKLNCNQILSIDNIKNHIPQAFSLVKTLGKFLDLLAEDKHKEVKWAVENIFSVINNIDAFAIAENLQSQNGDGEKDSYIYFYEDFLFAYDAESKQNRGVYYTPPAVVTFIVDRVSEILKQDFNLREGLASSSVKLLDFACGTGTFLFESYKNVLAGTVANSLEKNQLIEHLLQNFFGFEIMISSYIISHLKLSQFLKEQGFDIATKTNKRIGVYLTNTLENKKNIQTNLLAKAVADEGNKANAIKQDKEIIAIIGNPPYNVSSQNKLHDENHLHKFHENYKPKDEKKLNIDDDYIKFIAFAHKKINDAGKGVVGVIVNNSFLKGLTHRKMRNELLKDFDKIYIIDLHGNARIGETAQDGTADQNVFDIMQGVCIILLVKNPEIGDKGVFHLDLYGKRKEKFSRLESFDRKQLIKLEIDEFNKAFRSTKWGKERFVDDLSFFSPMKEATAMLEYGKFWGLTDIFGEFSNGVLSKNDDFCMQNNKSDIIKITEDFKSIQLHEIKIKYSIQEKYKDLSGWNLKNALQSVVDLDYDNGRITKVLYRPFDSRWTFLNDKSNGFLSRPRTGVMQHMLYGNVGLVFCRQTQALGDEDADNICGISDSVIDVNLYRRGGASIAPLYLHRTAKTEDLFVENAEKVPNFKPEFVRMVAKRFAATPEEVLAFIYAQMHSPAYRAKYLELLKIDFPRINFDVDLAEFTRLAKIGQELIDAHLMKKIATRRNRDNIKIGSCISKIGFEKIICQKTIYNSAEQRIYLAKEEGEEVYFDGVSSKVWNFKIGGYQVLDKYLKERVGRILSLAEIKNIENIINVVDFTIDKMAEIG